MLANYFTANLHHHYTLLFTRQIRISLTSNPTSSHTDCLLQHLPSFPTKTCIWIRTFSDSVQLSLLTSSLTLILASESMCFCPYFCHHQHCQSVSLIRSVPSYYQRICHLPTHGSGIKGSSSTQITLCPYCVRQSATPRQTRLADPRRCCWVRHKTDISAHCHNTCNTRLPSWFWIHGFVLNVTCLRHNSIIRPVSN